MSAAYPHQAEFPGWGLTICPGTSGSGWRIISIAFAGEPGLYGSVQHVQKIAVVNDTILVFTPDEPDFSQEVLEQIL